MLLSGLVFSMHTCSYCSGQKDLCCKWQPHLGMCLLQGERSTPKEMTVTNFKIVPAFTNQQWAPVPLLVLRHFQSDASPQCTWGKAKTHLLKNTGILHSATSRGLPTKLNNTTKTLKITQCKGVELEEKGTFVLADLLFQHASQIKEFFIYQGWFLHSSGNCFSRIYFSDTDCPELHCFIFQSAPKAASCLKNMAGLHCRSPCMVSDLKANAQLL